MKGSDARNTELVFVNALFEPNQKPSKQLIINRPINHYQPIINDEIEIGTKGVVLFVKGSGMCRQNYIGGTFSRRFVCNIIRIEISTNG